MTSGHAAILAKYYFLPLAAGFYDRRQHLSLMPNLQKFCIFHHQANDINPGTFYNWISRLRKKGMVIPRSAATTEPTAELQEVVKVDLTPSHAAERS